MTRASSGRHGPPLAGRFLADLRHVTLTARAPSLARKTCGDRAGGFEVMAALVGSEPAPDDIALLMFRRLPSGTR